MQKTTFGLGCLRKTAISSTSDVTRNGASAGSMSSVFLPTDLSEQTLRISKSVLPAQAHSLIVCDRRLKEGSRTSVVCASSASLIHKVVKVLPVPQAIII